MKQTRKILMFTFLFMLPIAMLAQTIKGKVTDKSGNTLPYMNVLVQGTSNGVTTNDAGEFSLAVKSLPVTLVVSSMGFETKTVKVTTSDFITITVQEASEGLDEVVITGNRIKPRTILDSPVPIDNIDVAELVMLLLIMIQQIYVV